MGGVYVCVVKPKPGQAVSLKGVGVGRSCMLHLTEQHNMKQVK